MEHNKIKTVVFHPMQQHSYKTAKALINSKMLYKYYTSVYYNKDRLIYRLLDVFLKGNTKKKMHAKCDKDIDKYVKTYSEFYGLLYMLIDRLDKTRKKVIRYKVIEWLTKSIGRKVANDCIKNNIDVIITYDTWAYGLINQLKKKKSNIKVIIDYTSLYAEEILNIINKDIKKNEYTKERYKTLLEKYKNKYMQYFIYEKDNTDYFFSPSSVVDNSLTNFNVDEEKIFRCTYGTNFENIKNENKINISNNKITFLYIGRISYAKGVHYLIDAFKCLKRDDFELLLVGSDFDDITKGNKNVAKNIKYLGTLLHSQIPNVLRQSDVLITASLYDGFPLSALEGFSYNLPFICTDKTGTKDFVKDEVNGFVVESQNAQEICEKVSYLLNNKEIILKMKNNVSKMTINLSWDKYEQCILSAINKIMN